MLKAIITLAFLSTINMYAYTQCYIVNSGTYGCYQVPDTYKPSGK